jgi:hypothetical protein
MDPFDKNNLDDFDAALFDCMKSDREVEHWKPPKWILMALITIKVAAAAALVAIAAVTLNK